MTKTLLFLHILGAIVAFGPTFAIPVIGALAQKDPMHAGFATNAIVKMSTVLIAPFSYSMLVTGGLLMWSRHIRKPPTWLAIGIVLYVLAALIGALIQAPTGRKLAKMLNGEGGEGNPMEMGKKLQTFGIINTVLFLTILAMMVFKPGA